MTRITGVLGEYLSKIMILCMLKVVNNTTVV